jgi:flagellar hook-length control protein FliK
MPTLPILPGPIQPGPIQAAAPTGPVAPADPTADPNVGTFLDQLAAALASLAPAQPAQPAVAAPQDDVSEDGQASQDRQPSDPPAQSDDTMVDLAASFGLVPMPLLMPLAVANMPAQRSTGENQADVALPTAAQTGLQPTPLLGQLAASVSLPASPSDAPAMPETQADEAQPPADERAAGPAPSQPTADAARGSNARTDLATTPPQDDTSLNVPTPVPAEPARGAMSQTEAHQQPRHAADSLRADAVPMTGMRAAQRPEANDESSQGQQPGATTTTTAIGHTQVVQQPATGSETHAGSHRHSRDGEPQQDAGPTTTEATSPSASTDATAQPAPFATVAGMAGASAPNAAQAAHPREVVSQIAQQAELYRLPGGRGVRIQLHPDDLGGVEVTLRYGAAGGLQLHVNVEHAATGELVQSGWSDLRDALTQQGISPDRLVMSVSGPGGASLSSDSGSFGSGSGASFSQDSGPSGFGQSPSQGQQDRQPAPGRVRWTPSVDVTPREPDPSGAASSSRIDLRV